MATPAPATAPTAPDSTWLHAWYDPVAGLKTFSQHMRLADLGGDGEYRLVVADLERTLKVYKGTGVASTHALQDTPAAVATFISDASTPRIPSLAVAAGPFVYVYRNMRPYLKFTLPSLPVDEGETAVWEGLNDGSVTVTDAVERLSALREGGVGLTTRSADLLGLQGESEREAYVSAAAGRSLVQRTVVTAMESIPREREGESEVSSLVIGTEAKQLLILAPSGSAIETAIQLPSVPTHIAVAGVLGVDYRISVACRDGVVYAVRGGQLRVTRIDTGTLIAGLVRAGPELVVATVDGVLAGYDPGTGKQRWKVSLPAPVTAMTKATVTRASAVDCVAVALEGGEVRLYAGPTLATKFSAPDTVTAMRFGRYGREAATLVLAGRAGTLTFKMLRRTAKLDGVDGPAGAGAAAAAAAGGPPPEQDTPLPLPKKTRLYLELAERERSDPGAMHRAYQADLLRLRVAAARAYHRALVVEGGGGSLGAGSGLASAGGSSLRLAASVQGLGPDYTLRLDLTNAGAGAAAGVDVSLALPPAGAYALAPGVLPLRRVPLLVPGQALALEFPLRTSPAAAAAAAAAGGGEAATDATAARKLRCLVTAGSSPAPAVNAVILLPPLEALGGATA